MADLTFDSSILLLIATVVLVVVTMLGLRSARRLEATVGTLREFLVMPRLDLTENSNELRFSDQASFTFVARNRGYGAACNIIPHASRSGANLQFSGSYAEDIEAGHEKQYSILRGNSSLGVGDEILIWFEYQDSEGKQHKTARFKRTVPQMDRLRQLP